MSQQEQDWIKDSKAACKAAADFGQEAVGTIQKSYLQATQVLLSGYSDVVQKAIDYCDANCGCKESAKAAEGN